MCFMLIYSIDANDFLHDGVGYEKWEQPSPPPLNEENQDIKSSRNKIDNLYFHNLHLNRWYNKQWENRDAEGRNRRNVDAR